MIVPRRSRAAQMSMMYGARGVRGRRSGLGFALTPAQQAFYSAAHSGCVTDPAGNLNCSPLLNPMLAPETATTDLTGSIVTQDVSPTATQPAAQSIAGLLGGAVVPLPNNTTWSTSAPQYGIKLPDGRIVDATAAANILNNDALYPNAAQKQAELDRLVDANYQPVYGGPAPITTESERLGGPMPAPAANPKKASAAATPAIPGLLPGTQAPATAGGSTAAGGGAADTGGATGASWFEGSMFGGVPNWVLLAGAGGLAVLFLGGKK